jgi:hypothetical protein
MSSAPGSEAGRRWPLLSAMFRVRPSRLALTSAGLIAAAIVGVQLGQSAISDINPVHFQGPLAPEGITPPPEPAPYDPYAQTYVWSTNPAHAFSDDTVQTGQAAQFALDQSAGRDPALPPWRDATPNTELRPWPAGALPSGRTFERYMHYPVDRAQAEQPLPEADAARTQAPAATSSATPAEALRVPAAAAPGPTPAAAPVVED